MKIWGWASSCSAKHSGKFVSWKSFVTMITSISIPILILIPIPTNNNSNINTNTILKPYYFFNPIQVSGLQELGSGNQKSVHGLNWENISTENRKVCPGKYLNWEWNMYWAIFMTRRLNHLDQKGEGESGSQRLRMFSIKSYPAKIRRWKLKWDELGHSCST